MNHDSSIADRFQIVINGQYVRLSDWIKGQIQPAILAEREDCAKIADRYSKQCHESIPSIKGWKRRAAKENEMMNFGDLADEIRARSGENKASESLETVLPIASPAPADKN